MSLAAIAGIAHGGDASAVAPVMATSSPASPDSLTADLPVTQTLGFQMLPDRLRHRPQLRYPVYRSAEARADVAPGAAAEPATRFEPTEMTFTDRSALVTRLRELDGLRLITFWDSPAMTVFFGLSRDGFAGLNVRQSRSTTRDEDGDAAASARPDMRLTEAPSLLTGDALR